MKNKEKKVKAAEEEAKKEVQTEENGIELTDEQLKQVVGGKENLGNTQEVKSVNNPMNQIAVTASADSNSK